MPALQAAAQDSAVEQIPDDRLNLAPGDTILLIVEDDPHYARVLVDLARDKGFKVLVASRGAQALDLAKQFQPTAVSLDVFLPDMLGWTVLSQLKQNALTRHIPVQVITLDEDRQHALARGAFSFVTKPTTTEGVDAALSRIQEYAKPRRKRLLLVEDNAAEQMSIRELLGHNDIEIVTTDTDLVAVPAVVTHLARAQAGVLTRAQLRAGGVTAARIESALEARRWRTFGRTVVVLHNGALSTTQRHWVAVLLLSKPAALAGLSAAAAAGLTGFEPDQVHIVVAHDTHVQRRPG